MSSNTFRYSFSLNKSHYVGNGVYSKSFQNRVQFLANSKLSIESFHMYNSFFNITAEYNNNQLSYKWIDGTVYNMVIPDGYYEVSDLDYFVKQECIKYNLYVYNSDKTEMLFFHKFETNINSYSNRIGIEYFPDRVSFLNLGFHLPDNASWTTWLNTGNNWNQKYLIQLDIKNLNSYFGMKTSLFPRASDMSVVKNYYYNSDTVPQLLKVNSLNIMCNLINSPYNQESSFLTNVRINNSFGNMISLNASLDTKYTIKEGSYSSFIITLYDEDFKPLKILDPNMSINLIIETVNLK